MTTGFVEGTVVVDVLLLVDVWPISTTCVEGGVKEASGAIMEVIVFFSSRVKKEIDQYKQTNKLA